MIGSLSKRHRQAKAERERLNALEEAEMRRSGRSVLNAAVLAYVPQSPRRRRSDGPDRCPDDLEASWDEEPRGRLLGPSEKRTARPGVPPFRSDFPAFAARSNRVQYESRKRSSCSPVIL